MSIDVARLVRVPISDASVRRIIIASVQFVRGRLSSLRGGAPARRSLGEGGGGGRNPPPRSEGEREGVWHTSISVAFIGPARMRVLNRMYHEEDRVTDILAFGQPQADSRKLQAMRTRFLPRPMGGGATRPPKPWRRGRGGGDLGELVICPSYVNAQAKRAGEPFRRELTRVLVHGTLHLLGHDHATPRQAEMMFSIQELVVAQLSTR
ncbi:MAG: rRNA maturation RNase YbeY [bacterium]|nr:rRNA maturation RNase YbeY [bacterium]